MPKKTMSRLAAAKGKISGDATVLLSKLKGRLRELEAEREKLENQLGHDNTELKITEREEASIRRRLAEISANEKALSDNQKEVTATLKKVTSEIENLKSAYAELAEVWDK